MVGLRTSTGSFLLFRKLEDCHSPRLFIRNLQIVQGVNSILAAYVEVGYLLNT